MAWRALVTADVLNEFTKMEQSQLNNIQGSTSALSTILADTIAAFIGAMSAAAYDTNATVGTIPDQLREYVIARARWRWLVSFPQMKVLQTPERKQSNDDAVKAIQMIQQRTFGAIESPNGTTPSSANWNSENRIVMRTHPVPPPSVQYQDTPPIDEPYANPNAPGDN